MSATTQCYRHSGQTWIANCPDCTAWHLAAARTRHDEVASAALASIRVLPRQGGSGARQLHAVLPAA